MRNKHQFVNNLESIQQKLYNFIINCFSETTVDLILEKKQDGTYCCKPLCDSDEDDVRFFKEVLLTYEIIEGFMDVFLEVEAPESNYSLSNIKNYSYTKLSDIKNYSYTKLSDASSWMKSKLPDWMPKMPSISDKVPDSIYKRIPSFGKILYHRPEYARNLASKAYEYLPDCSYVKRMGSKISNLPSSTYYQWRFIRSAFTLRQAPGVSENSMRLFSKNMDEFYSLCSQVESVPGKINSIKFMLSYTYNFLKILNLKQLEDQIDLFLKSFDIEDNVLSRDEKDKVRELIQEVSEAIKSLSVIIRKVINIIDRINEEQISITTDLFLRFDDYLKIRRLIYELLNRYAKLNDKGRDKLTNLGKLYLRSKLDNLLTSDKIKTWVNAVQEFEIDYHLKPGLVYSPLRRMGEAVWLTANNHCSDEKNVFSLWSYRQYLGQRRLAVPNTNQRLSQELIRAEQLLQDDVVFKDEIFNLLEHYDVAHWIAHSADSLSFAEKALLNSLLNSLVNKIEGLSFDDFKSEDVELRKMLINYVKGVARSDKENKLSDQFEFLFYLNSADWIQDEAKNFFQKENRQVAVDDLFLRRIFSHLKPADLIKYLKNRSEKNLAELKLDAVIGHICFYLDEKLTYDFNMDESHLVFFELIKAIKSDSLKSELLVYLQKLGALDSGIAKNIYEHCGYMTLVDSIQKKPSYEHYELVIQAKPLNRSAPCEKIVAEHEDILLAMSNVIHHKNKEGNSYSIQDYIENPYALGEMLIQYRAKCEKNSEASEKVKFLYEKTYGEFIGNEVINAFSGQNFFDSLGKILDEIKNKSSVSTQDLANALSNSNDLNIAIEGISSFPEAEDWIEANKKLCGKAVANCLVDPKHALRELCKDIYEKYEENYNKYKEHGTFLGSNVLYRIMRYFCNILGIQITEDKILNLNRYSIFQQQNLLANPAAPDLNQSMLLH